MLMYNCRFEIGYITNRLYPEVPRHLGKCRDTRTKRIRLFDSVEHCMQALANDGYGIYVGSEFILSVAKMGVNSDKLVTPKRLVDTGRVPDALLNREYWCLSDLVVDVCRCRVTDYKSYADIDWERLKPADVMEIASYMGLWTNDLERYVQAKTVYEHIAKKLNSIGRGDVADLLWDRLFMTGKAQAIRVAAVQYQIVERYSNGMRVARR